MSLRWKLMLTFLVVIGASFAIMASILTGMVSSTLYQQRTRQATRSLEQLASSAAPFLASAQMDSLSELLTAQAGELGGRLLAGLDNGFNYAFDEDETKIINTLPFNPLEDEDQMRQLQKDDSGIQFSHTAHEQLTGQLKAGLQLLDLYEDTNGYGNLHAHNIPTYWATLARKA